MQIGVISDPHGCLVGLRTALDWLENEGMDLVVCAGDVVNFGPQPNECVSLLVERNVASVQGNCDRFVLSASPAEVRTDARSAQLAAINDWCRQKLTPASRQWLAALPGKIAPAPGVLIVHGGLQDREEIVAADARPAFPEGVSLVAAGHLHVPFLNRTRQGIWVNAGSAGRPCDGDPRAALAVLEQGAQGWSASIHRVPFDLEAAVQAIRKAGMPNSERLAETQRSARWW
jgi:predicted phosphodiesterase